MLARIQSTLEADQVGMLRTERFATPHAGILSQRVTVLGVTLTHPQRDAQVDLS